MTGGSYRRILVQKALRTRKARQLTIKRAEKVLNQLDHRDSEEAYFFAVRTTKLAELGMHRVLPYDTKGNKRKQGDKAEFFQWADLLCRLLALRLPYERPRLSAMQLIPAHLQPDTEEKTVIHVSIFNERGDRVEREGKLIEGTVEDE